MPKSPNTAVNQQNDSESNHNAMPNEFCEPFMIIRGCSLSDIEF